MPTSAGGLPANPREEVLVVVGEDPDYPPRVYVEHHRFVGVPHVLTDGELCIYLDPHREWDPRQGAAGFLNRLHDWFADAIANRFDPATALYHPVGGRAHTSLDAPLVVCADEIPTGPDLGFAWLRRSSNFRLDLIPVSADASGGDTEQVLVITVPGPLFAGPGATVRDVFVNLGPELQGKAFAAWTQRLRRQFRSGREFTHLVLAVPNPAGGMPYLMVGRTRVSAHGDDGDAKVGLLPVEWCTVDDQRPSVSTRRDERRPVRAFRGRDVVVIGCGGLGSWIGEFVARAGARSLALLDPAIVKDGLLVRQNYADADVGRCKDEALATRIVAVAPRCRVTTGRDAGEGAEGVMADPDGILIDATVSLAVQRRLDIRLAVSETRALVAQVATDVASGSLGLVHVAAPTELATFALLDANARQVALGDGNLEAYLTFWEPREQEELVPARGCSIPTFHGSAADMAAVAAEMVNLIAPHVESGISGTHLFALPHAGVRRVYAFLPINQLV